ncbi:hypothetical protein ACOJQI_10055 [Bacillus salacetis]|uniref:hypothetical protein n=1 Tax=Bacillus salacetis TaxID=2315464 RepID=UPI003B9EA3C4
MMTLPNFVWYILLSLLSLFLLIYTFIIKRKEFKKVLSVYMFISGLSFIVDFIILVCFKAYTYNPEILESEWFDSIMGSFTSQAIAVPAAAVFLTAFQLGWQWIFLFTAILTGIELFFLNIDIYKQYWWSTVYTAVLLPIGFRLSQKWYHALSDPKKIVELSTIYLGLNTYAQSLKFFLVVSFSSHQYQVGLFSDPLRDSIFGNSIYLLIITVIMSLIIVFCFKWYIAVILIVLEWAVTKWLEVSGILKLAPHWNTGYFSLLFVATLLLFRWIYIKVFEKERFFI